MAAGEAAYDDAQAAGSEATCVATRALVFAAAGTTGAVLSTTLFYPVELVKNRLQAVAIGGGGFAYTGLVDGLRTIVRDEGLRGAFTGLGPVLSRCVVSDFATFYFGELLLGLCGGCRTSAASLPLRIAGASASTMLSLPLENISTRVTVSSPPVDASRAAAQLWLEGGPGAFWRGGRVMQVLCVNPALTMCSFEWLRRLIVMVRRAFRRSDEKRNDEADLSFSQAFAVGVAAKLFTLMLVYPLIRAKFLIQARDTAGAGLFQVLREVHAEGGLRSLYRGLDAQLSKSLLSTALLLATKERTERPWRALILNRCPQDSIGRPARAGAR